MFKEVLIIIIIVLLIIVGDIGIQGYISKSSDQLVSQLEELTQKVEKAKKDDNNEEIKELSNNIYQEWEEINKKWSIIVVHSELDLIELSLIGVKATIESNELEDSLQELEKSTFLVGHIKEKESLKLKNIF